MHAPCFCGTPVLHRCATHGTASGQVFVASRALIREGYETRTKCWSTLFAHMAGFAMISTLLKAEPTLKLGLGHLWHYGIMCNFSLKSVKSESADSLGFMGYD